VANEKSAIDELWYNLPSYSLKQAINLAAGVDPDSKETTSSSKHRAIHNLLINAVKSKLVQSKVVNHPNLSDYEELPKRYSTRVTSNGRLSDSIDLVKTRIDREDLIPLLNSHGLSFPPQGSGLLDEKLRDEIKRLKSELSELKKELSQIKREAYIPTGSKLKLSLEMEREQWVPWLNGDLAEKPTEKRLLTKYLSELSRFSNAAKGEIIRVSKPEQAYELDKE
jgi:hypothetical protein